MTLVASLLLALHAGVAQPPASAAASTAAPAAAPSTAARDSARRDRKAPRHLEVTPELASNAFADATARTLLAHAHVARLAQDSALRAYDAKTYQRISVGMGLRKFGRERLLMRMENAARVSWDRGRGVTVEPTGRRAAFPAFAKDEGDADLDDAAPIPYFPGRESLWFPSSGFGVAKAEVDDREFVHPLAKGAEAYYRYATGDSLNVRLPDGRTVALREMRISARRPDWHLFVGSFWFDVDRGQLVRAAYRMAVDMDIWQVASDETKNDLNDALERARLDTGKVREEAIRHAHAEAKDDEVPKWVKGFMSPMKATISAITVEYGLHEGRFWLPRRNVAEAEAQAGFMRVPVKVEETFRYDRVVGDAVPGAPVVAAAPEPAARPAPTTASVARPSLANARTALDSALALEPPDSAASSTFISISIGDDANRNRARRFANTDSTVRRILLRADSSDRRADSLQAAGDTAKAREAREVANGRRRRAAGLARRTIQCASDSTYDAGTRRRFDGELPIRLRLPCDTASLANSADLPKSIYEPGEELFSSQDRDALVKALDLGLQPGWAPQPIKLHAGLDLARYNRIEALSVGGSATSALGAGYTAQGILRFGVGDLVPNAELGISRDNGRRTIRLGAFHRLGVANDDWGSPLTFGSSLASLLYGRDEGFYYRTFGAELSGTRATPLFGSTVQWRLFGERQRSAGVKPNTQASLANAFGDAHFIDNIDAQQVTITGGSADVGRTFGEDPSGFRLFTRNRLEVAAAKGATLGSGDATGYGRLMTEMTASRGLGPISVALTGGAGGIAGDAPAQRLFYVGGLQTVRGQYAKPTNAAGGVASGYVGDAFWLTRAEVGTNDIGAKPVVFFDMGWAGPRADWQHPGRPLTGAGIGLSFMDGLIRTDLSRGIYPQKRTRFDLYVEARF